MNDAQQQLALACRDLANEIASGPSFFDDRGKITPAVLRYTGAKLAKNTERCALVAALKLLHYSDRKIAEVIGCDTRSIRLMVAEIEKSGAIPALKQRLVELVGANAEQAQIAVRELLDETLAGGRSLDLASMIKAVGQVADFMAEKHQLLTGAPTEIRAQVSGPSQAEVEQWAKENAIEIEPVLAPVDSDSTANVAKPQQIATSPTTGYRPDTEPTPDQPTIEPPTTTPKEEGGGSLCRRRAAKCNGFRAFQNFSHEARTIRRVDCRGRLGGTTERATRDVARGPTGAAHR